jgi:Predicted transcriptional regulator
VGINYQDIITLEHNILQVTTMTGKTASVRMDEEKLRRLDKLAGITKRSRGWLINEAVDRYLSYEEWYIKAVEAGMEDVEAGRVIPHEEIKKEWEVKLANSMD